ncbi:MAG: hypothetical protein HYU25_14660 [Candidatus Rokubacteria bacterium]|nr:hypothetical protein [Candidatus Rokubacteria bacterium]
MAALAIYVFRARPESSVNRWFAAHTATLTGWVLGIAGLHSGINLEMWSRVTFFSASLIPWSFLAFTQTYPTPGSWPPPRVLRVSLVISAAFAVLSLTTPLIVHDIALTPDGPTRKSGPLYPILAVYILVGCLTPLGVFIGKWRQARGQARAQLQYLGTGLFILGVGAITANLLFPLLTGSSPYSWLGPFFILPLVALVGHAIIRHRLMDLRLVINRGLAHAVTIFLLSGALVALGRFVFETWSTAPLAVQTDILVVSLVALLILSTPAQKLLDRLIDPYLYRGRIEHSSALRDATRRLSYLMQPAELSNELREILTEAFLPESFVMLAYPFDSQVLEQVSSDAPAAVDLLTLGTLMNEQSSSTVLIVNPSRETGPARAAHEILRLAGVEVIVILRRRGQLLGAILLGPRRSGDAYFKNDLLFIESLSELASIALENALLYKQRIHMLEYSDRLLESLDSAVVAVDLSGQITSFNPASKQLLGLSEANRGEFLSDLPSEVGWALALAVSGLWHPRDVEVTIDHEIRGIVHAILSTAVLHGDQGRIAGALAVVTDLSTIKALERNQRRVEHFAVMARFYAGIAHEIRNPLAAISNFIAMLPDRFDDPEYRDTMVRLLPIEVNRIVRLSDRLRLMAPSEGGKLSVVALPPLLNDIVAIHSPAAQEQQVKIQLHCPDELPKLLGDPSQLVQLFVNLLKNAIEAMRDGGTVTVEAETPVGRTGSDSIIVRVIDEGPGIDPAVRPKIFEPFFTTKASGTGLGLSICREIADFHRARLALLPRGPLGGTVAEIEFPCVPTDVAAT